MKILYLPNCYSQQRQYEKKANIYPVRMAMEAEWHRKQGDRVYWGHSLIEFVGNAISDFRVTTIPENLPFLSLPAPDRVFTRAKQYTSGNYKYLPGTHIMAASGCWWGACTFCVEKGKPYEVRPVDDVIAEIVECRRLGFREVFDDSATFPVGKWLEDFCKAKRDFRPDYPISCNMRLVDIDYKMLKDVGFRMLLFGLESANQETLGRINKGTYHTDYRYIIQAANAGLDCHAAVMFGCPNETDEDAIRTLKLVHWLLRKGYAKTAQASFYQPPVGTPFHIDLSPCAVNYARYNNEEHKKYVHQIYNAAFYPDFWLNQLKDIRNLDDIKYIWRGIKSAIQR